MVKIERPVAVACSDLLGRICECNLSNSNRIAHYTSALENAVISPQTVGRKNAHSVIQNQTASVRQTIRTIPSHLCTTPNRVSQPIGRDLLLDGLLPHANLQS